jgi:hypothetical protein
MAMLCYLGKAIDLGDARGIILVLIVHTSCLKRAGCCDEIKVREVKNDCASNGN